MELALDQGLTGGLPAKPSTKPARILVVDDDLIVRRMLAGVLQQNANYQVSVCENCDQAWLGMNRGYIPDLCLLDLVMPEKDGLTLLSKMRAMPNLCRVKVIVCSAVHARPIVNKCLALGACAYLTKPFQPQQILTTVKSALNPPPAPLQPLAYSLQHS